jgi:anti-anti-sigma factor
MTETALRIDRRDSGGTALLAPSGRIDAVTAGLLEEACRKTVEEGDGKLLLDLSGVDYVSSAGLRAILAGAKRAAAKGGGLALFGLEGLVKEVFLVSGFDALLPVAEDEAGARARL